MNWSEEDFFKFFHEYFPLFHKEFISYGKKNFDYDESIEELTQRQQEQLESILHSTTYLKSKSCLSIGAYLAFMVSTRQILGNGNKRTAFAVMFFYCFLHQYDLKFKPGKYTETISKCIKEYEEAPKGSKALTKQKLIKRLTRFLNKNYKKVKIISVPR